MRRVLLLLASLLLCLSCATNIGKTSGDYEEGSYYARCNLKVLKGRHITWVNWQSSPTFIPVGTKLRVARDGKNATLLNQETGSIYTLDIGNEDKIFNRCCNSYSRPEIILKIFVKLLYFNMLFSILII